MLTYHSINQKTTTYTKQPVVYNLTKIANGLTLWNMSWTPSGHWAHAARERKNKFQKLTAWNDNKTDLKISLKNILWNSNMLRFRLKDAVEETLAEYPMRT